MSASTAGLRGRKQPKAGSPSPFKVSDLCVKVRRVPNGPDDPELCQDLENNVQDLEVWTEMLLPDWESWIISLLLPEFRLVHH